MKNNYFYSRNAQLNRAAFGMRRRKRQMQETCKEKATHQAGPLPALPADSLLLLLLHHFLPLME